MNRIKRYFVDERCVSVVIVINAVTLFALGFLKENTPSSALLLTIDYLCVWYFLIEAILKIRNNGWREYWARNWNRFDFLIVILSTPALLTPFFDLHDFAIILVLRLGRLFRLFRLLSFVPNRDHLMDGIVRALKASIGVFLALFLVNVILALGATYLFGDAAPEYFGNPLLSCYSLFKVFTLEGWYEIPDAIVDRTDMPVWAVVVRGYFVICVLVGGILGLSLANAVFVDEMMMDNTADLEAKVDRLSEQVEELKVILESKES